jgi:hypothetical protein
MGLDYYCHVVPPESSLELAAVRNVAHCGCSNFDALVRYAFRGSRWFWDLRPGSKDGRLLPSISVGETPVGGLGGVLQPLVKEGPSMALRVGWSRAAAGFVGRGCRDPAS